MISDMVQNLIVSKKLCLTEVPVSLQTSMHFQFHPMDHTFFNFMGVLVNYKPPFSQRVGAPFPTHEYSCITESFVGFHVVQSIHKGVIARNSSKMNSPQKQLTSKLSSCQSKLICKWTYYWCSFKCFTRRTVTDTPFDGYLHVSSVLVTQIAPTLLGIKGD